MAYVRTVKTASGATAVQHSSRRGSRDIEHIGSAHDDTELDAELEALNAAARQRLAAGHIELGLGLDGAGQPAGGALTRSLRMRGVWPSPCSGDGLDVGSGPPGLVALPWGRTRPKRGEPIEEVADGRATTLR